MLEFRYLVFTRMPGESYRYSVVLLYCVTHWHQSTLMPVSNTVTPLSNGNSPGMRVNTRYVNSNRDHRWLRFLLLCLCVTSLINSFVYWFCTTAVSFLFFFLSKIIIIFNSFSLFFSPPPPPLFLVFIFSPLSFEHRRELISARNSNTSATTKAWVAYGNSHLECV